MLTLLVSAFIRQSLRGFSVEMTIPDGRVVDVQASPSVRHIDPHHVWCQQPVCGAKLRTSEKGDIIT